MVDGIKTVPTAERKREYEKARGAWQGLIPDPAALLERKTNEPLKLDAEGAPLPPLKENWQKRIRKDGTRPEGVEYVMVRRCKDTGRFAKGSRSVLGKKKKRPA
ncbi:MAG TPA: hypothetical protein VGE23_02890 [Candidatus Paceibacterota bacterium]